MHRLLKSILAILVTGPLAACNVVSESTKNECCIRDVNENNIAVYEKRARDGDKLALVRLSKYYSKIASDGEAFNSQLATAEGDAADKARYWAELSFKRDDRTLIRDYISNYIERSRNTDLSVTERRRELIQALWVWQRVPPDMDNGKYWKRFTNVIPDTIDLQSVGDFAQQDLQEIILAMRALEAEAAKSK